MRRVSLIGLIATLAATAMLVATVAWAADGDGDGVEDSADNCLLAANPSQADADMDGFGDACDPDYDNNGIVDEDDLAALTAAYGGDDAGFDHDGSGSVGLGDYQVASQALGGAPGPSGLACAGTVPCP